MKTKPFSIDQTVWLSSEGIIEKHNCLTVRATVQGVTPGFGGCDELYTVFALAIHGFGGIWDSSSVFATREEAEHNSRRILREKIADAQRTIARLVKLI